MKILHIGFGKTATTSLQKVVFPEICDYFGIRYIGSGDICIRKHRALLELGKKPDIGDDFNNALISSEGLCSWDPYFWDEWANKNAQYFGHDSHVLLIIREPRSYLKSVYLQRCLHEGNVMSPQDFFLTQDRYSPRLSSAKFSIEDFSYNKIISIYAKKFQNLTVVKYEELSSLSAIKSILEKNNKKYEDWEFLSDKFRGFRSNSSYSQLAVNLTFLMQRILNLIGFSLAGSEVYNANNYTKIVKDFNDCASKPAQLYKRNIFKRIVLILTRKITWRNLMTKVISKVSRKKFKWNEGEIEGLNITNLSEEYEAIYPITHFHKGLVVNE